MDLALGLVLLAAAPLVVIAAITAWAWRERSAMLRALERVRTDLADQQNARDQDRDDLHPRLFVMTSQLRILRNDLDRLAGEVRELKQERARTNRLFHLVRQTGATPELQTEYLSTQYLSTEYLSTEYLSTEYLSQVPSRDPSAGGPDTDDIHVVDVRVVWLPDPGSDDRLGRLLIQRTGWQEPPDFTGFGEVRREAFYDDIAAHLVDAGWTPVTEYWVTPAVSDLADVATRLDGMRSAWHNLVLGRGAETIGPDLGLARPAPDLLASIVRELPVPGEEATSHVTLIVQVTGIVIGPATGTPLLADACVRSLAHDVISQIVRHAVTSLAGPARRPDGHRVEPLARRSEVPQSAELTGPPELDQQALLDAELDVTSQ